jgi:hypothetical protein
MASFGKVLDLLDDRYLNLQDVIGNVVPLPTLVPYENYQQNVLVYRMDTNHELFMGLIQDFTARMSQQLGKELWTWCVQWEVDARDASAHSPKKPRLDAEHSRAVVDGEQTQRRAPIIDVFDRQVLDPELTKEEDMLRILIDIVQVDSTIVPNFIEFLYRWIDYYEGDGKALKAALKWEIPSLWDFEYHPLILPADIKKKVEEQKAEQLKRNAPANVNEQSRHGSTPTRGSAAQDLIQGLPTKKMREKPDLAAMERQTEESERLQYREVKYGIQPPKLSQPISPLINIPRDPTKRVKYYAACFKSRQRALVLLLEAGVSMRQISNYQKLQEEHPRDTPEDGDPKELKGLRNYHKDAGAAQDYYKLREKLQLHREKQKEIAISNKLAIESHFAIIGGSASDGSIGTPLISRTRPHARRPDMAADMLIRIRAARGKREETINFVPTQLVGRTKSRLMESAKDRQLMQGVKKSSLHPPHIAQHYRPEQYEDRDTEDDIESDNDTEESSFDDDDASESPHSLQTQPPPHHPGPHSGQSSLVQQQDSFGLVGPRATGAMPAPSAPTPASMAEYMRNLTPEQAERLVSRLSETTRQAVASSLGLQFPSDNNVNVGTLGQSSQARLSPSMHRPWNTEALPYAGLATGVDPRSAPMPPLPSSAQPPTYTIPSPSGSNGPPISQSQMYFQAGSQSSNPLSSQPSSQPCFSSSRGTQSTPNGQSKFSQPPQISRPPQVLLPTSLVPPLPRYPPLPFPLQDMPSHTASQHRLEPQHNAHGTPATTLHTQQLTYAGSALPAPAPSTVLSLEHFLALRRQQDEHALVQAPHQPRPIGQAMNQCSVLPPTRPCPPLPGDKLPDSLQQRPRLAALQSSTHLAPLSTVVTGPQPQPPQPISSFPPIPSSIQRNAPIPLAIPSPTNPFSSLAPHLLATSPFAASPHGMPIQIYFPRVVVPGNGIGPDGARLGNNDAIETDAFLIGYAQPGGGKIVLSKALFMPVGVWTNSLNRVRKGAYEVLETYLVNGKGDAHRAVYTKLVQAYMIMRTAKHRERELTKRWRASQGPMTQRDRGAVWEGWGVVLDRGIEMGKGEREGAFLSSWMVDEGVAMKRTEEQERRWREIEEMLEEDDRDEDDDI